MFITDGLATFGRYLQLMGKTFSMPERWRMFMKQYVKEMAQLGYTFDENEMKNLEIC